MKFVDRHVRLTKEQAGLLDRWRRETGNSINAVLRLMIKTEAARRVKARRLALA